MDGRRARALAEPLLDERPEDAELLEVVAAASAAAGDSTAAVDYETRALAQLDALDAGSAPPDREAIRERMVERLAVYRDGRRWTE